MTTKNNAEYLLVGFESFQSNPHSNGKQKFSTLNELITYLREMNLQQEYFDIIDVKAGKQIAWAELN